MSLPVFCDACQARVEWHVTVAGARMPIDPDAHPDGRFIFGPGLRLTKLVGRDSAPPGKKTYRCHWDTCPKGNAASKRGLKPESSAHGEDVCERFDCTREGRHFHCFTCGATDHFAPDCPEAP